MKKKTVLWYIVNKDNLSTVTFTAEDEDGEATAIPENFIGERLQQGGGGFSFSRGPEMDPVS